MIGYYSQKERVLKKIEAKVLYFGEDE